MKDDKIKKALEWLEEIKGFCSSEEKFVYVATIVDLINRQQAEIEELKVENKKLNLIVEEINDYINPLPFKTDFDNAIEDAKSEAIKEFAERLKKEADTKLHYGVNLELEETECVEVDEIDNLVKEMVGENK